MVDPQHPRHHADAYVALPRVTALAGHTERRRPPTSSTTRAGSRRPEDVAADGGVPRRLRPGLRVGGDPCGRCRGLRDRGARVGAAARGRTGRRADAALPAGRLVQGAPRSPALPGRGRGHLPAGVAERRRRRHATWWDRQPFRIEVVDGPAAAPVVPVGSAVAPQLGPGDQGAHRRRPAGRGRPGAGLERARRWRPRHPGWLEPAQADGTGLGEERRGRRPGLAGQPAVSSSPSCTPWRSRSRRRWCRSARTGWSGSPARSSACCAGAIGNHAKSTGRLDVDATWQEQVDDLGQDLPQDGVDGRGLRDGPLPRRRLRARGHRDDRRTWVAPTVRGNGLPTRHELRHQLGDTRHRLVVLPGHGDDPVPRVLRAGGRHHRGRRRCAAHPAPGRPSPAARPELAAARPARDRLRHPHLRLERVALDAAGDRRLQGPGGRPAGQGHHPDPDRWAAGLPAAAVVLLR